MPKKSLELGRILIIKPKSNEVAGLKLSYEEIKSFNPEFLKKIEQEKEDKAKAKLEKEKLEAEEKAKLEAKLDYKNAPLSIIVTDLGQNKKLLKNAEKLPKEVNFAFSPYSDDLPKKIEATIKSGRQALLTLMFEPSGFPIKDTGPLTIISVADPNKNLEKITKTIGEIKNYSGFITNEGEIISQNLDVISPILKQIRDLGKFFGYHKISVNTFLENEAKPLAVDIFAIDFIIDEKLDEKEILTKLKIVEDEILVKKRKIVISLKPYKISIDILSKWLEANSGKINIAPITYFVTDN
ncbi:MAG: divergent polysaccharide deacetylase family protein [Rickettsiales bacterium]|nr:divergent polysaccharide deacetylase family protein [Rickettsiales bacterium]